MDGSSGGGFSHSMDRRRSYRALPVKAGGEALGIFDDDDEPGHDLNNRHHSLDSCFFCKGSLGGGRDIFMYRGDTPFCSEECREEQMEIDEAEEVRRKSSWRKKPQQQQLKSRSSKGREVYGRAAEAGTAVAG